MQAITGAVGAAPAPQAAQQRSLFMARITRLFGGIYSREIRLVEAEDEPGACWDISEGDAHVVGVSVRRFDGAPRNQAEVNAVAVFVVNRAKAAR